VGHAAGRTITDNVTPQHMPTTRGILTTTNVRLAQGAPAEALREALEKRYAGEPFVKIAPRGVAPATRHVRGSNLCLIGVFADRVPGRAILVAAIDNLVKGASGQAVQNFNLMHGFPETTALEQQPLFP
ncbi:MAG: Asd/ArgC dimerization domain-containing protein, partial [Rhodospirillales bacterium]